MTAFSFHILDLQRNLGDMMLKTLLESFECPLNPGIATFLKHNALAFAQQRTGMTYLVLNDKDTLLGYFTLTHKATPILRQCLSSNTARRKYERFAALDAERDTLNASAFLIAQFGKNYALPSENRIAGCTLMDLALEQLGRIQYLIGGGIVYLECEDNERLLDFYTAPRNNFRRFGERRTHDGATLLQLSRLL